MTGYHTGHASVRANGGGASLLPEDVTIAEVLKQAGYKTGCFGKWGLGDHGTAGVPYKQGFDEFFGYLHQVHAHFYYTHFLWENDQQFLLNDKLYDLTSDPAERHDVGAEQPDIVKRVGLYLEDARTPCRDYPPEEPLWSCPPLNTGFVK